MQLVADELNRLLGEVYKRTSGAVRPGLDTIQALLACLEDPQHRIGVIHVAGTNGKGSICAMLDGILREAGFRTGMYTSPHLVRLNERFRLNGEDVSDALLYEYLNHVLACDRARCEKSGARVATFFELMTALAYSLFADRAMDIALIETGMGGQWDATNVTVPLLSIITNVELDHVNFLGDSIEQIAREKAGIIKQGRPVVLGAIRSDARPLIEDIARKKNAMIIPADELVSVHGCTSDGAVQSFVLESNEEGYGKIRLPLLGVHQVRNCACAVAAYEAIGDIINRELPANAVKDGLANTRWPGRFHYLRHDPDFIVDGAHNEAGVLSLLAEIEMRISDLPIILICGMLQDKDVTRMVELLAGAVDSCVAVTLHSERSLEGAVLVDHFSRYGVPSESLPLVEAVDVATKRAAEQQGAVVAAGSLFLVGELLETMNAHE